MDEEAISSNALVSILLDGGIVKDWCKRTFRSITLHLRDICIQTPSSWFSRLSHGFLSGGL